MNPAELITAKATEVPAAELDQHEHSSPGGGLIRTTWLRRDYLCPGLVCRVDGAWRVIIAIGTWPGGDTASGIYAVELAPLPGSRDHLLLTQYDGAEVRLDLVASL